MARFPSVFLALPLLLCGLVASVPVPTPQGIVETSKCVRVIAGWDSTRRVAVTHTVDRVSVSVCTNAVATHVAVTGRRTDWLLPFHLIMGFTHTSQPSTPTVSHPIPYTAAPYTDARWKDSPQKIPGKLWFAYADKVPEVRLF